MTTRIMSARVIIHQGDNLITLRTLKDKGARFDLIELDGPYMAGLEDWDNMTEAQYIEHYTTRLSLVRDVLQPWGVVFVFGYPEGCAEIKSWCHRTGTLYLRRWVHWYNQAARHNGRKVQVVTVFVHSPDSSLFGEFRVWLKKRRREMGITIEQAHNLTGIWPGCRGGYIWFESETSSPPTANEYITLKRFFDVPDYFDTLRGVESYPGLTDLDFITVPVEHAVQLNTDGLRSKPVRLYLDLFRPTIPPTDTRNALILYGGSGNAGIAAAALGYAVRMCEQDPDRCAAIAGRWDRQVARWREVISAGQAPLFVPVEQQLGF